MPWTMDEHNVERRTGGQCSECIQVAWSSLEEHEGAFEALVLPCVTHNIGHCWEA